MATVVWNFGEYQPLAQMSYQTAFLLQGNESAEALVNTGESWRVIRNESYQPPLSRPPRIVVGPGEIVHGNKICRSKLTIYHYIQNRKHDEKNSF